MYKHIIFLLTTILLLTGSTTTHAQLKKLLKDKMSGVNLPSFNSLPVRKNAFDTVKIERQDLIKEVNSGKIGQNFEIEFFDGQPTIRSGSKFDPRDYGFTEGWVNPVDGFSEKYIESLEKTNTHKVKIKRKTKEGKTLPTLYGILEFNKVYKECSGLPVARSYAINIPRDFFSSAEAGNNTVLYEYYECRPVKEIEVYPTKKKKKKKKKIVQLPEEYYTTWVLWMFSTEPW